MLQAILGAVILLGIYKFLSTNSDYKVEWQIAILFIFAPTMFIFFLSLVLAFFGINPLFVLLSYIIYFLFPYYVLKVHFEYSNKAAIKFASPVPVVAILTEFIFFYLFIAIGIA